MGVEIKFTDKQLPVSPVFINFLHRFIQSQAFDVSWHDQLSEGLTKREGELEQQNAEQLVDQVLATQEGKAAIFRSYELLTAIVTGDVAKLSFFPNRYQFICVVGCPRHGGSYLTKQLFRAIGMNPDEVPNVVAHDGFPDASPFDLRESYNSYTVMMQNMAEYLTMIELFFANSRLHNNYVVVPKKATKAAYNGAFFHHIFGPNTEYIITLRHPVTACISTYEKSGGLPESGKFEVRGNIEEWARRDNLFTGAMADQLQSQDYFDVYLRYWEQYCYQLATTGLGASRNNWKVVVYGEDRMKSLAQTYFTQWKSKENPEKFHVFDRHDSHPEWWVKAEQAIRRVERMWQTVGLNFPTEQIMEGW